MSVYYKYNADGIRTSKTVDGVKHVYTLNGTQVLSEEWTEGSVQHLMIYVYDAEGSPVGFRYRNSTYIEGYFKNYIYGKNVLGDVLYVFNLNGDKVAEYSYDAWGYPESALYYNNSTNPGVEFSPFRYRGYWYDAETKLYYLNSRYYNPEWGRFLNADAYLNANGDIIGFNLFAYCGNNPVNYFDPFGFGFDPIFGYDTDEYESYEDYLAGIVREKPFDYPFSDEKSNDAFALSAEHHKRGTTNKAKEKKHQKGQARKARDNRGEKGDTRRKPNPNKRKGNTIKESIGHVGIAIVVSIGIVYLIVNDGTGIGVIDDALIFVLLPIIEKNLELLY